MPEQTIRSWHSMRRHARPPELRNMNLDRLPFPIAYPLHALRTHDPRLGASVLLDNAIFAAYQTMRLAALLMLADYVHTEPDHDPRLPPRIRGLTQPHWQEWSLLADALARFWIAPERSGRAKFLAVAEGWRAVARSPDATLAALVAPFPGPGRQPRAGSAMEAVSALRNDRAHRNGVLTVADMPREEQDAANLVPLVEAIASRVFGRADITILRALNHPHLGGPVIRLNGPHPDLRFEAEPAQPDWLEDLEPTQIAALTPNGILPVYPMFVPTDDEHAVPPGMADPAAMLDGVQEGRHLVVLGVQRAAYVTGPHLAAAVARLRGKHADLRLDRNGVRPWTIDTWSRMEAQLTLLELTNRKYFPSFYLERPGVDDALTRLKNTPGGALVLLGEAGAGKSSLLARLAEQRAGPATDGPAPDAAARAAHGDRKDDIVLWLAGRADYVSVEAALTDDQRLLEAIARKAGILPSQFPSLAALSQHLAGHDTGDMALDRLCWIILDGLNEADRFVNLVAAIDRFLPHLAYAPRMRLVVAMRSGAFFALADRHATLRTDTPLVFEHHHGLLRFADVTGAERPWLEVRPFRPAEAEQAYRLRQAVLAEGGTSRTWDTLDPELQTLLFNPLYLHLFHKTWDGRLAPRSLAGEGALLDAYLDTIAGAGDRASGGAPDWLDRLGNLMLERRRAFLSIDDAETWRTEWVRQNKFEAQAFATTLDPVEQFVAGSVLLRPADQGAEEARHRVGYTFTQQKLAERVVRRSLSKVLNGDSQGERSLDHWLEIAKIAPQFAELQNVLADVISDRKRDAERSANLPLHTQLLRCLVEINERRVANSPEDQIVNLDRFRSYMDLERVQKRQGLDLEAVETQARLNAVVATLRLVDLRGVEHTRDLWINLTGIGEILQRDGKAAEARLLFLQARVVAKTVLINDFTSLAARHDFAVSCSKVADVSSVMNEYKDDVIGSLNLAIRSMRSCVARHAAESDPAWRKELGEFHLKRARARERTGLESTLAIQDYNDAIELLEPSIGGR